MQGYMATGRRLPHSIQVGRRPGRQLARAWVRQGPRWLVPLAWKELGSRCLAHRAPGSSGRVVNRVEGSGRLASKVGGSGRLTSKVGGREVCMACWGRQHFGRMAG